ncbi:MAG: PD-(D/E)XK motif protein [bacterium]
MIDILKKIETITCNENELHLIEKINDEFGFFIVNNRVSFIQKNNGDSNIPLSTNFLEIRYNVHIESVKNDQSFVTGRYDIITFNSDYNSVEFNSFIDLCYCYANDNTRNLSFVEFFNNLVELFKQKKNDEYTNLIGLVGELIVIKEVYENTNVSIAPNWQKAGVTSRFDFSFKKMNFEVKTTTSYETKFKVKHNQIFNNQNMFIVIVSLIETGTNYSLRSLCEYFRNNSVFYNNFEFIFKIELALTKVKNLSDLNKGFSLDDIRFIARDSMDTVSDIPVEISSLQYTYDFKNCDDISWLEIKKNLEEI